MYYNRVSPSLLTTSSTDTCSCPAPPFQQIVFPHWCNRARDCLIWTNTICTHPKTTKCYATVPRKAPTYLNRRLYILPHFCDRKFFRVNESDFMYSQLCATIQNDVLQYDLLNSVWQKSYVIPKFVLCCTVLCWNSRQIIPLLAS